MDTVNYEQAKVKEKLQRDDHLYEFALTMFIKLLTVPEKKNSIKKKLCKCIINFVAAKLKHVTTNNYYSKVVCYLKHG